MSLLVAVLLLTLLLVTSSKYSTGPPSSCDPLVPESCSLPFPNDFWLIKDANNTPMNLALNTNNFPLPKERNISTVNPLEWNALLDGFSPLPCILTFFSNVSINNCPRLWNISQSIADDTKENVPIIILQASNNKHVPFWVELDHISDTPITHRERNRTLMIWPAERLIDGERYIIGIRNMVTDNGKEVQVSSAFQSLRDSSISNDTSVNFRREWFNNKIFPLLIANGFERHSLQLAWDFTVQSTKSLTSTMIHMRDDAFSRIDDQGVQYRITSIVDNPSSLKYIGRKIKGLMSVPWYLNDRLPSTSVRIVREWSFNPFMPVFQQMNEIEFEMLIPESISNLSLNSSQIRFLQYGHGLYSSFREIEDEYLRQYSNQYGYILAGVNWLGMCTEDIAVISEIMFLNITNFPAVPDRCFVVFAFELFSVTKKYFLA